MWTHAGVQYAMSNPIVIRNRRALSSRPWSRLSSVESSALVSQFSGPGPRRRDGHVCRLCSLTYKEQSPMSGERPPASRLSTHSVPWDNARLRRGSLHGRVERTPHARGARVARCSMLQAPRLPAGRTIREFRRSACEHGAERPRRSFSAAPGIRFLLCPS